MASTTGSRLAQAVANYEKATAWLSFHVASNGSETRKASASVPIPRMPGSRVAEPTNDQGYNASSRGGSTLEAWDQVSQNAFAAGRVLERCIVEHRFGRKEPVTHKWYGVDGEEVRVTKAYAAGDHNFPESTPWLP